MVKVAPRSKLLVASTAGLIVCTTTGGYVAAQQHKTITLSVDGHTTTVSTFSRNVDQVLQGEGIDVDSRDEITPDLSAQLSHGDTLTIRRARPVTLVIDGRSEKMWTTADNPADLMQQHLGAQAAQYRHDGEGTLGLQGARIHAVSPKTVRILDAGVITELRAPVVTVGEAIAAASTPITGVDEVSPDPASLIDEDTVISITRKESFEISAIEPYDLPPVYEDDATAFEGQETVKVAAQPGSREVRRLISRVNYVDVSNEIVWENIVAPAVAAVIVRGVKPRPTAPAEPNGVWDRLAMCEATGNWSINTGNGFSGGLQFTPSTWSGFGGGQYAPMAYMATREQQIAIAKKVLAVQGWGAWPACTAKMGLR